MHYYQHHIGDFIKDTSLLSNDQAMTYLRMIWRYYADEKPLSGTVEDLAFDFGSSVEDMRQIIRKFFVASPEGWRQGRCDKEIQEFHERSEKARAKAVKRWSSKSTKNATAQEADATALPQHCSSNATEPKTDATHIPIYPLPKKEIHNTPLPPKGETVEEPSAKRPVRPKKTKPTVEDAKLVAVPETLARSPTFVSQWHAWLEWRWDKKKSPLDSTSVAERLRSFEKHGPERSEKAMRTSIANGWIGVFPEKETVDDGSINRNSKTSFSRFDEEVIERNAREFIQRHGSDAT